MLFQQADEFRLSILDGFGHAIENLWQALEKGQSVDTIMERINKRQEEKAELEAQLAIEAKKERIISAQEVTHFLSVLQKSNFDDPLNRRAVINIFLNKIYLYDDKFRLVLNGSGQPVEIDNIMLDDDLCIGLLPFYLAAQLLSAENEALSAWFMNRYREFFNDLRDMVPASFEPITTSYGGF